MSESLRTIGNRQYNAGSIVFHVRIVEQRMGDMREGGENGGGFGLYSTQSQYTSDSLDGH